MILVDANGVVAAADHRDPNHSLAARWLRAEHDRTIPAPVTAEVDYILSTRGTYGAARRFVVDVAAGSFTVECLQADEYPLVLSLMDTYADLEPGLADLSIVILAYRFNSTRILTFDQKHFRAMKPLQGGNFTLLPFDEPPPEPDDA
jgi:predicted nucleic acid-binding protein